MNHEDEALKQKIRSVAEKTECYSEDAAAGSSGWGGRQNTKILQPFGTAQNAFNQSAADAITSIGEQIEAMNVQIAAMKAMLDKNNPAELEQRMTSFVQEQRQYLLRTQFSQQEAVQKLTTQLNESLCTAAPASRADVGIPPLSSLPLIGTESLFQELHAVQQAKNEEQTAEALDALDTAYAKLLRDSIAAKCSAPTGRSIVLVIRNYASRGGMTVVRNEVHDIYRLLKTSSRYQIRILSLESEQTEVTVQGDVFFVPEAELSAWLKKHDPILLILFDSNIDILNAGGQCMLLRSSILRLTDENPTANLRGSQVQEILHLCDMDIQHYVAASHSAAKRMEELGFRKPTVLYPYFNTENTLLLRKPRIYDADNFTVGFVSSPFSSSQSESRGIPALCKLVKQSKNLKFLVIWREGSVPIPDALEAAQNCEIRKDDCDLTAFYSEIDCILIPYANENGHHACSPAAVRGMLMGIPAVSTTASGISELIAASGLGVLAESGAPSDLQTAILKLRDDYEAYQGGWRIEKLRNLLSAVSFVRYVESCVEHQTPYGAISIQEWDRQLKQENKHLVKGHAAIKAYYQRQEIAKDYAKETYRIYPANCFDIMERKSVSALIEHFFPHETDLKLLDMACGDGRILQGLLQYGECTGIDSSATMLMQIQSRLQNDAVTLKQIDPLVEKPKGQYDVVTAFHFLRHFEYSTRKLLWEILRELLSDRGILLIDVPNLLFEMPNRQRVGWGKYNIYDVFWTKESIRKEAANHGLQVEAMIPIGQGLYPVPATYRNEPMTWTAAIRKQFAE